MSQNNQASSSSQLVNIVIVFFFWGFLAASNGIFIPFCKSHFQLSQFQSQLVDFAFYFAYFLGSAILFGLSAFSGMDILNRIGYKKGIVFGLLISVAGALAMIPAVNIGSFPLILGALFIVALGFSLQQTSAQPFVIALGNPETGSHRLNLAGGVNSLGTTLGPIIVSLILFGGVNADPKSATIESINILYVILSVVFVAVAVFLWFSNLPSVTNDEPFEQGAKSLQFPQLKWGMAAIFVYVGVEVTIQSNMGALLATPAFGSLTEANISQYISLYWGSLMIGRWTGAIGAFNLNKTTRNILTVALPFIAFGIILGVNIMRGSDVSDLYLYAICIMVLIGGFFLGQEKPAKTLMIFGALGALAMIIGLMATGQVALYAFLSGGLVCSIMWPCIFSLASAGLGKYTSQGSGFLIMMIVGGAIIPPAQGILADNIGIHLSYVIPVACFAFLTFFAWHVKNILQKQGIDFDAAVGEEGGVKKMGGH
jgi:FHS family L-fucose permease-like MFS transporter